MDIPEKAEMADKEVVGHGHHSGKRHTGHQDEIERIDSIALAPETTLESFAHLDEKKILRKVGDRAPIARREIIN